MAPGCSGQIQARVLGVPAAGLTGVDGFLVGWLA